MTRQQKLFKYIDRSGLGLEIGPGPNPIAPKLDGFKVEVVDYALKEVLIKKFQAEGVSTDRIEEVDHVWQGQSYAELTGVRNYYDWIIASHVIEHVPDLIGFLNSCSEVLQDRGVVSLAIPDKRFCFDRFRPVSSLGQVIDSHLMLKKKHSVGSKIDFDLNYVRNRGLVYWDRFAPHVNEFEFANKAESIKWHLNADDKAEDYVDCHAWCFTPNSFRLLVFDLYHLGLTDLREIGTFPAEGAEFLIALGKHDSSTSYRPTRLELVEAAEQDQLEAATVLELFKAAFGKLAGGIRSRMRRFVGKSKIVRRIAGKISDSDAIV